MDNVPQPTATPPPPPALPPLAPEGRQPDEPLAPPAEAPVTYAPPRPHGPWQIKSSRTAYHDPWLSVRRDEVLRPDGLDSTYAIVRIKPGICVVALDDQGQVHLTEEFHYAVGRTTIEGVSGGIEPGDTATETAQRELIEELGITAKHLRSLGTTDAFSASIDSPTALFVATGLTFGPAQPEATELIGHVVMPLSEAVQGVLSGAITHSPTCIVLLRLAMDQRLSRES